MSGKIAKSDTSTPAVRTLHPRLREQCADGGARLAPDGQISASSANLLSSVDALLGLPAIAATVFQTSESRQ